MKVNHHRGNFGRYPQADYRLGVAHILSFGRRVCRRFCDSGMAELVGRRAAAPGRKVQSATVVRRLTVLTPLKQDRVLLLTRQNTAEHRSGLP